MNLKIKFFILISSTNSFSTYFCQKNKNFVTKNENIKQNFLRSNESNLLHIRTFTSISFARIWLSDLFSEHTCEIYMNLVCWNISLSTKAACNVFMTLWGFDQSQKIIFEFLSSHGCRIQRLQRLASLAKIYLSNSCKFCKIFYVSWLLYKFWFNLSSLIPTEKNYLAKLNFRFWKIFFGYSHWSKINGFCLKKISMLYAS